ncbi:MAG: NAD(P)/FAD-dependent oxidoreductase [Candidatus Bathyarchaeia archaeon]|nr:NAD(P)/FAD-dependent oxidoreductase [Candidatus Bathyarchaeota archaeon]
MKHDYDVAIIGGGPCGSFSAFQIAKNQVTVAVFEEHPQIGVPTHCPGHLSINGLKRLGLYPLPPKIIENIFYGAKFYSPKGIEFSVRLNSPVTCTVNRSLFDKYIAHLAEKSGAKYYLHSRVTRLISDKFKVIGLEVQSETQSRQIFSKIIIDAEGITARLLKSAGLNPPEKKWILKAVHAEVENIKNVEDDIVEVYLGNDYAPGFYFWIIPKKDGVAKIGLAARSGNPGDYLEKVMKKHPIVSLKLKKSKITYKKFHSITLGGPISKAFSNGFLAIGDAASQVKPTTGGGIITGLTCSKIAAEITLKAISSNDTSAKFLRQYQERISDFIGFDMKVMRGIRKLLNRTSDKKIDIIAQLYNMLKLEAAIKKVKEIDYQGKAVISAIRDLRILAFLIYSLIVLSLQPGR